MKKVLIAVLVVCMSLLACACGNSDKNVSAINNDLFEHMIVNDIYGSSFYISKGFIRKQLLNKHKHNLLENLNVIDSAGQRRVISLFAILHNNTA